MATAPTGSPTTGSPRPPPPTARGLRTAQSRGCACPPPAAPTGTAPSSRAGFRGPRRSPRPAHCCASRVPNVEVLTCGPLTLGGPSPASTVSLTWALYPAEKTKDRGSNTVGARLNRVEDKVGTRALRRTGSGHGHGPRAAWALVTAARALGTVTVLGEVPAAAADPPSSVASCVRAAPHPGLGSGPPYPGAHVHSPTRSRCRSPGPWFVGLWHVVSLLMRGTWCPEAPLGSS